MIFAGILIGIVITSIGWIIFALRLNNEWADITREINHSWSVHCTDLIDRYYGEILKEGE